ncbi:uncharacterized protein LOC134718416 [Mytilus trossulus]|uniref:uncharacterized protein LOC134718416 n=1 Tax=Mytilus trossulus TaxID=6551 RepID=UPI003004C843
MTSKMMNNNKSEPPNALEVPKRRGDLKRLFSERSKTRGGRGRGRGRGGKSSKVLLENNNNIEMPSSDDNEMSPVYAVEDNVNSVKLRPKRKTAKVLVYEDDSEMEVPDSREISPVVVLEDVVLNSSLLREASVLMANMDFYVDPTDKEPTEASKNQVEQSTQPEEKSEKPDVHTNIQPEEQTEVHTDIQPEEQTEVHTDIHPEEQTEVHTDIHPEVHTDIHPEVHTDIKPED